jgi:predicted transcriptional regulator
LPEAPSYSTVRALLRILEEKGHIKHLRDGARYVYQPRVSRETARRSALKRVVATFFQGSVAQTVAALLETADTRLSDSELHELQQTIEQARKEGR